MLEVSPHTEMGPKPKLSPHGCTTKEEELKSLCAAAQARFNPHDQPGISNTCRTTEEMSAPRTEMGLALAAVDFGDMCTWELGQVRICVATTLPRAGPETYLKGL